MMCPRGEGEDMVEHAACYVCGTTEAVSSVAVVPPRHVPEGDPETVALCADCRDRISTLIEPLVDRADALAAAAESQPSGESSTPTDTLETSGVPETDSAENNETPQSTEDSTAVETESSTDSEDTPEGYRSVLRLLRNRDEPIDREAAVSLATNAYELEPGTVRQILDVAIERGALVEREGRLHPS